MNDFIQHPAIRAIEGTAGPFRHTFGGALENPVVPPGGRAPCHLLYLIDTDDPLFPFKIEGVRMLPLLYCQQYNAAAMSYRVTPGGIEVESIESLEWSQDFPYTDYPPSFPRRNIRLEKLPREHVDLLERYIDADDSDPQDWDTMESCEEDLKAIGYPFTQFGGRHVMWQGIPSIECPACRDSSLDVFGVIWNAPVQGVSIWDNDPRYRGDADVQIIYQICHGCSAIHVCNRCT